MSLRLEEHKNIFFLGIGGISMSALALILSRRGYNVSGYDKRCSNATKALEAQGIKVYYDHSENNCKGADLCVFSAAFHDDNEEMVAVRNAGIELVSRATLLGCIAGNYDNSIAVAGTHGKSTTSGMLSQIFLSADNSDPTILVGAELPAISSTFRTGTDGNFIFEACEYMDSFLQFYPTICVVLNVELDHTDYFHDIEQMQNSFTHFLRNSKSKTAVVNADSPHAVKAAQNSDCETFTYSLERGKGEFYPENIVFTNGHASFDAYRNGAFLLHADLSVPGLHNVSNALAAIAASVISGVSTTAISKGLNSFHGVCRRFEYKGKCNGANVYDDYAHHPREVEATLDAALRLGANRIIAAFEPHTYSRLHDFLPDFARVLKKADKLFIVPVYAARETNTLGCDSTTLASMIPDSVACSGFEEAEKLIRQTAQPGDAVITMGAGDINLLAASLVKDA